VNEVILDKNIFGNLTRQQLFDALKVMFEARLTDERVMMLQKTGHAKFGIFGAGKEAVQVAAAQCSRIQDPFAGYYRDLAFGLARGINTLDSLKLALSVRDEPTGGGRSMTNHYGNIDLGCHTQSSPTGSQVLTAYGIADSWKLEKDGIPKEAFAFPTDSIVLTTLGDSSMREGEVKEFIDNIATDQSPCILIVENDGMGISVDLNDSIYDGDCVYLLRNQKAIRLEEIDGTDFVACHKLFTELFDWVRTHRKPVVVNASVSALFNHSSTDDRLKYVAKEDVDKRDPILILSELCLQHNIFNQKEIDDLKQECYLRIADEARQVIGMEFHDDANEIMSAIQNYNDDTTEKLFQQHYVTPNKARDFEKICGQLGQTPFPLRMGNAINHTLAQAMLNDSRIVCFGEDVADLPRKYLKEKGSDRLRSLSHLLDNGKIKKEQYSSLKEMISDNFDDSFSQKGGVFNVTKNLQRLFGDRCHNTGICEATIIGKAVGYLVNGLIPVPEIQFMDYLRPAMQQLEDELATLSFRSNKKQFGSCVIRIASFGYLGGAGAIWHSTAEMGPRINRPGFHMVVPSNARDAVGLLRTALYCQDPVIFAEPKALYNQTHLFDQDNWFTTEPLDDDFRIPFGKGKLYRAEDSDLTIITYGNTVPMSLKAAKQLEAKGIKCQVIDLRTLKPLSDIDWELITQCLEYTGKLLLVDEDRVDGGFSQILAGRIASDPLLFEKLDAPIRVAGTKNCFIPYGSEHEALIALQIPEIIETAQQLNDY